MNRFSFEETSIKDLYVVRRNAIGDSRGFFSRFFCAEEFSKVGWDKAVRQINQTLTSQCRSIRGMHYQKPPYAETKIVSVLRGEVWDVVIDIRRDSDTFLQWHAERLSAENRTSLYIPEGFAHGFQTLSNDCELIYLHSSDYRPGAEAGINPFDHAVNIDWPYDVSEISDRDKAHALLTDRFEGI